MLECPHQREGRRSSEGLVEQRYLMNADVGEVHRNGHADLKEVNHDEEPMY
ncbi:MAG TPA: hypothetical protein VIR61_03615 [Sulfuricaulis sp.]